MEQRKRRFTEGMVDTDVIVEALGIAPGQTVADVGCGTGYMAILFADRVGPDGLVHALDVNEIYIRELQEQCNTPRLRAQVCNMSGALPLDSGSMDIVYVSTVIHSRTSDQLQAFISEARRVLKPGGILAVVEIAKHDTPFGPPLSQRYSPEELQTAIPLTPVRTVAVADHFYMQLFRNQAA